MRDTREKDGVTLFKGSSFLKLKLLLATLSGKSIRITDIRNNDENRGLKEYEVNLIRLFDKITNGTRIELSDGGTHLFYQPGVLHGGNFQHDCCLEKGIGKFFYFNFKRLKYSNSFNLRILPRCSGSTWSILQITTKCHHERCH